MLTYLILGILFTITVIVRDKIVNGKVVIDGLDLFCDIFLWPIGVTVIFFPWAAEQLRKI